MLKSAKITLIHPPTLQLRSNLSALGAMLPIGLAYVAAVLRDAGHEICVIDAPGEAIDRYVEVESPAGTLVINGLTPREIVERIDPETEIIGITHMFIHEWPFVREIAEGAKKKIPGVTVILGGENSTAFWDHIFKETDAVDYCVLGEGESSMVPLVQRIQMGDPATDLKGVAVHPQISGRCAVHLSNNRQEVSTVAYAKQAALQLGGRIEEPDSLPWPAWEYFPVEQYMRSADHYGVHRGKCMPLLATRGCPYQCTFCSNPQMWTTRYVTRKPEEVVKEMKFYVEKYGAENFNFCDLTAIVLKEWILEFCSLLKKEKLDITWQLPTGTRSEALDEQVLSLVYETGCRNITYAPESGSDRMLRVLKKKVQLPRMLGSLRSAHRAKLVTRVNIIIGHPREKPADTLKSLWFLMKCALAGCQDAAVMIFAPYPGSEDTKNIINKGQLTFDQNYYYLSLARSGSSSKTYNPYLDTQRLLLIQFLMLLAFYAVAYITRPWRFISLIRSIFTGNEQTALDALIRTKLQRDFKFPKNWMSKPLPEMASQRN